MTNLSSVAQEAVERAAEHANAGDLELACLKLSHAFWLAVTTGVTMDKTEADMLKARVWDAVGYDPGAA